MDCDLITRRNAVATAAPLPMVMLEWSGLSIGAWLSLVEHLVRDQGVGGSNPLAPIYRFNILGGSFRPAFFLCPHECPHGSGLVVLCRL